MNFISIGKSVPVTVGVVAVGSVKCLFAVGQSVPVIILFIQPVITAVEGVSKVNFNLDAVNNTPIITVLIKGVRV